MPAQFTEDDWTSDLAKVGTWDLWCPAHDREPPMKLIDTLAELMHWLSTSSAHLPEGERLADFMKLPAARAMPEKLRLEVEAYRAR